jgi:uncharacterized protein YciI
MLPALEPYTLVVLVRGERAGIPEHDEMLDELQAAHVAYIQDLVEQGKIAVSGPIVDSPDGDTRGIAVFRAPLEEAQELAGRDPAVLAGRLAFRAMTWWAEKGRIRP